MSSLRRCFASAVLLLACGAASSAQLAPGAPAGKDGFRLLFDAKGGFKLYRQSAQDGGLQPLLNPQAENPASVELYRDGVQVPLSALGPEAPRPDDPGFRGPAFAAGELRLQVWGLDGGDPAWSCVRYELQNAGAGIATVSFRVLLDTWLAEGTREHAALYQLTDGAKSAVVDETRVLPGDGDQLLLQQRPGSGEAFGLLVPSRKTARVVPQRVVVANVRRLQSNPAYEFEEHRAFNLLPFSINDSAVGLFYDTLSVMPGQKIAIDLAMTGQADLNPARAAAVWARLAAVKPSADPAKTGDAAPRAPADASRDAKGLARLNALIDRLNAMLKDPRYRQGELERLLEDIEDAKTKLQP